MDADIEGFRSELGGLEESRDEVQQQYYAFGTEIARIEDGIQYQTERVGQLLRDLEQIDENRSKVDADRAGDIELIERLLKELEDTQPEQQRFRDLEETSGEDLLVTEQSMQRWQSIWDDFNHAAADARKQGEVQQSRIEHLEQAIERQTIRMSSLRDDIERMQGMTDEQEIGPLEEMLVTQEQQLERIESELEMLTKRIERQREENASLSEQLDDDRSELQLILGRRASLEELQQAALGQQDDAEVAWLSSHGLAENPRLVEQLKVEDDWVLAVETVLGETLQAVCVPSLDAVGELLGDFTNGSIKFIAATAAAPTELDRLAAKVSGDVNVSGLLHGVYTADSLEAALAMRDKLSPGDSVVTKDGIWLSANWLRVSKDTDDQASIIRRQTELDQLDEQVSGLRQAVEQGVAELDSSLAALFQAESDRDTQQARMVEQQRTFSETRAQLGAKRVQAEQIKVDITRAEEGIESCEQELKQDRELLSDARNELQVAMDRMEQDALRRVELIAERENIQSLLDEARIKAKAHRESAHDLALKIQSLESQIASAEQAMTRLKNQQRDLDERRVQLTLDIKESESPQGVLKQELDEYLAKRLQVENELMKVRKDSETVEFKIRGLEQDRNRFDESFDRIRAILEETRLEHQTLEVRKTTIREQMIEEKADLDQVLQVLPEEANEKEWEDKLRRVGNRMV